MMLMVKKRTYKDPLSAAMDWYLRVTGTTADDLGKGVGYKNGKMIGHIRGELSSGSEHKRRAIAKYFGKTYEEFLEIGQSIINGTFNSIQATIPKTTMTAKATAKPPPQCPTCKGQVTQLDDAVKRHQLIVTGFTDNEKAMQLNQMLITIEQRAPEKIALVEGYLRGLVDSLPAEDSLLGNGTEGK